MSEVYNNDSSTSLAASVTAGATSLSVASSQQFNTLGTFRIRVDDEIMTVTAVSGTTWTVTRASELCEGVQTAAPHAANAAVYGVLTNASLLAGFTGSAGVVTSVSVVTANGVSATVATPTTTPALTFTLGNITPNAVAAVGGVTGSNLSGTNTGDQTITLTSDVTGTGVGSFVTTIAGHAVTYAKMQAAAAATLLGNPTGGSANLQEITLGSGLAFAGSVLNTTGAGTVSSVGLSMPAIFTVASSPVTSAGTLTVTLATETANTVWSGPTSGGAATPTFRALVSADIPTLSYVTSVGVSGGTTGLTTSGGPITSSGTITISGILIAANGGLGSDTSSYTSGQIPVAQGAGSYSADSRRGLYTGSGAPAAGLGFPGDYYIDLSTTPNAIYLKS